MSASFSFRLRYAAACYYLSTPFYFFEDAIFMSAFAREKRAHAAAREELPGAKTQRGAQIFRHADFIFIRYSKTSHHAATSRPCCFPLACFAFSSYGDSDEPAPSLFAAICRPLSPVFDAPQPPGPALAIMAFSWQRCLSAQRAVAAVLSSPFQAFRGAGCSRRFQRC